MIMPLKVKDSTIIDLPNLLNLWYVVPAEEFFNVHEVKGVPNMVSLTVNHI